jgi:hypothetical protein
LCPRSQGGQHIARVVGLLLDVVAPGVGSLLFSLAKALYEVALAVQQLEVAAAAQRDEERRARAELDAINAEIAALEASMVGAPPPPAVTQALPPLPAPAATPSGREAWYAPVVRWADREWRNTCGQA